MSTNQPILGIICDMDGTLVHEELDFEVIRREIGLPSKQPILEAIGRMPAAERMRAEDILHFHERRAAEQARLVHGVVEFLRRLDDKGVRRALLTRNSRSSAAIVLDRCGLNGFDPVLAREDGPYKPDPAGILAICRHWDLPPTNVLMLGDYVFDVEAGRNAGVRTALITHGQNWHFAHLADFVFEGYAAMPTDIWDLLV